MGSGDQPLDDPPGSAGSPFFCLDRGEGLFKELPCPLEAHCRAKVRLAAGGKAKKHPTPPGTPVPRQEEVVLATHKQDTAFGAGDSLLRVCVFAASGELPHCLF